MGREWLECGTRSCADPGRHADDSEHHVALRRAGPKRGPLVARDSRIAPLVERDRDLLSKHEVVGWVDWFAQCRRSSADRRTRCAAQSTEPWMPLPTGLGYDYRRQTYLEPSFNALRNLSVHCVSAVIDFPVHPPQRRSGRRDCAEGKPI